ncbi:MAG: hypothetical protein HGJ94_07785 [Desulfosarcina sp.]|nr:hypothetical protein [Desulfosarcina sp.]
MKTTENYLEDDLDCIIINGSRFPFPDPSEVNLVLLPYHLMRKDSCCICGTIDWLETLSWNKTSQWFFNNGDFRHPVCFECAKKYEPTLYKNTIKANQKNCQAMDRTQMQDAQRCFGDLREAVFQLERTFQAVCENVTDLQGRLDKLESADALREDLPKSVNQ